MVIAIDGPAGAGKSTVARRLSQELGYPYIETGAMYRAVALFALRRGIALTEAAALEKLAQTLSLRFEASPGGNRLQAEGEEVTEAIRAPDVTRAASVVSTVPGVRRALVERQRQMGAGGSVIMEGRDIGTKVFPAAEVKVFLDASAGERSRRRLLQEAPVAAETPEARQRLERTEAELRERDRRDRERSESPLVQAPDAVYLDSSHLAVEQVVEAVLKLVRERGPAARP